MRNGIWWLPSAQAAHCRMGLLLWVVLVGCATAPSPHGAAGGPLAEGSAPRGRSWPGAGHPSRMVLAVDKRATTGGEPTGGTIQGYNVPGRNPASQMPWEFFLGNAAHRLIAYMYGVNHPLNQVFYNTKTLVEIVRRIGDATLLLPGESNLRPDITDVSTLSVFEIKPWNEQGLQEGRLEVQAYLAALNRAMPPGESFWGGTDFHGQVLIRFARGQYIWRLEWQTPEPGVVQYRWTRSQQRFDSASAAYDANQWVEITEQEMQQYGGWVAQAVEGMVSRRERLATFSGTVGVAIDFVGNVAEAILSGAIFRRMGSLPEAQQPPAQGGGGQVIPFPPRPPPAVPLPAAAGM